MVGATLEPGALRSAHRKTRDVVDEMRV